MTTQPSDSTRSPCRHVRLSLAAGSVLTILLPFVIGLKAVRHLSQNPGGHESERVKILPLQDKGLIGRGGDPLESLESLECSRASTTFLVFLLRAIRQIFLQLLPFLGRLLAIVLAHRYSPILVQIFVGEIAEPLVIVQYARGLHVIDARHRSIFINGGAQHQ